MTEQTERKKNENSDSIRICASWKYRKISKEDCRRLSGLVDFDKIQLSKIIEKVFIYEPGRMEISWKMDDIFYKEEKA